MVALRKESVDRNIELWKLRNPSRPSLSARRAWIEIAKDILTALNNIKSLSARRAWIEIFPRPCPRMTWAVALRKESVDRNVDYSRDDELDEDGRSPQGERG